MSNDKSVTLTREYDKNISESYYIIRQVRNTRMFAPGDRWSLDDTDLHCAGTLVDVIIIEQEKQQ